MEQAGQGFCLVLRWGWTVVARESKMRRAVGHGSRTGCCFRHALSALTLSGFAAMASLSRAWIGTQLRDILHAAHSGISHGSLRRCTVTLRKFLLGVVLLLERLCVERMRSRCGLEWETLVGCVSLSSILIPLLVLPAAAYGPGSLMLGRLQRSDDQSERVSSNAEDPNAISLARA
jgi:hypothetical protein